LIIKLNDDFAVKGCCAFLEPITLERRSLNATVVDCPVTLVETTVQESDEVIELISDNDTWLEKVCPTL